MKPINHLTFNLNQTCHSFLITFINLWGGRNQYTFLEKQNQQEVEDPQQYFDFSPGKAENDVVLLSVI